MPSGDAFLWITLVVCLTVVGAFGFSAFRAGNIEVSVREQGPDGVDLAFTVPAALVQTALAVVPSTAFREMCGDADVARWMPAVRAAQRELERLPDCVLVQVTDGDERVQVAKRQGRIVVEVHTEDDDVRVAVPVSTVAMAVRKLERATRG
jgi:hypothetical protein